MKLALMILLVAARELISADLELQSPLSLAVFSGGRRPIPVAFKNVTQQTIDREITVQLLQASSATIAPIQTVQRWRRLELLPLQIVNEEAAIEIPTVRAATRFLLRVAEGRSVIGNLEIWAYPSNLLSRLNQYLADEPLILYETPDDWKAALGAVGISFHEVDPNRLTFGPSKLVVVGHVSGKGNMLKIARALRQAKTAPGIIFIRTPAMPEAAIFPSYYVSSLPSGKVVVATPQAVTNLSSDPWSQLRLLEMAKLATDSEDLFTSESSH